MRNGAWMARAASASTTGEDTPSSRNEWCICGSTSFRVRDLPTSIRPKEEREAHLTGRHDCLARPSTLAGGSVSSASSSNRRLFLSHDHGACCYVLGRPGNHHYLGSLRPCSTWCSRP